MSAAELLTQPLQPTMDWIRARYARFLQGEDKWGKELLSEPTILMSSILFIITKLKQKQLLIPNTAQKLLLDAIDLQAKKGLPVRIIILKARQQGMSTAIAGWMYLHTICQRNVSAGILAHEEDSAALLFEKYRIFDEELNDQVRPPKRYNVRGKRLVFENGDDPSAADSLRSRIDVMVASDASTDMAGKTGRSRTYNYLHLSEMILWGNAAATTQGLFQTVPDHAETAIFNESTGGGYGDYFHQEWERACERKSDFLPLFLPWYIHHEYQKRFDSESARRRFAESIQASDSGEYGNEAILLEKENLTLEQLNWRRWQIRNKCNGRLATFKQEYPTTPEEAFQVGGNPVIDQAILSRYLKQVKPPIVTGDFVRVGNRVEFKEDSNGVVTIWAMPEPGCEYIIGSDHAEGLDSGDFNAAVVIERLTQAVVCRIRGYDGRRITPDDFAEIMVLAGDFYNEAWLNPENNADGGTVCHRILYDYHYRRLVDEKMLEISQTERFGWRNNTATRKRVVNLIVDFAEKEKGDIPDRKIVEEALSFVWVNGKPQAIRKGEKRLPGEPEQGFYDDCLLALGGALLAHQYLPAPLPRKYVLQEENRNYVPPAIKQIQEMQEQQRGYLSYV